MNSSEQDPMDSYDDKVVAELLAYAPKQMRKITALFGDHRAKRAHAALDRLGAKEDGNTGFWALPDKE